MFIPRWSAASQPTVCRGVPRISRALFAHGQARPYLGPVADPQASLKTAPNRGFAALWRFLPMLWPKGETELKTRVVIAVLLVLAGKAIGFVGPYALKVAVDRMSAHAAFAVVAGLVLAYA